MVNVIIAWTVLLVVLVVTELATMGLTTIWFAAGSLVSLIAAACGAPLFIQIALFLIVSVLMLVFTRPVAVKYFNRDRVRTNTEGLIGQTGIVTGEIDNVKGCGQVTLNGMEWTARALEPDDVILEGSVVSVEEIRGVKLIVKPKGL